MCLYVFGLVWGVFRKGIGKFWFLIGWGILNLPKLSTICYFGMACQFFNNRKNGGRQGMWKKKKSKFPGGIHPTDGYDKTLTMNLPVQEY